MWVAGGLGKALARINATHRTRLPLLRVTACGAARGAHSKQRAAQASPRGSVRRSRGARAHTPLGGVGNDGRTTQTMLASTVGWPRQLGERSCSSDFHGDSHATTCADWCKREKASNHWCANGSACTTKHASTALHAPAHVPSYATVLAVGGASAVAALSAQGTRPMLSNSWHNRNGRRDRHGVDGRRARLARPVRAPRPL